MRTDKTRAKVKWLFWKTKQNKNKATYSDR